ncbi:MAG: hypothetical protein ACOCP8_00335 [archaeon]
MSKLTTNEICQLIENYNYVYIKTKDNEYYNITKDRIEKQGTIDALNMIFNLMDNNYKNNYYKIIECNDCDYNTINAIRITLKLMKTNII